MAPLVADTEKISPRETRRRIVPAIPLRLSRTIPAARPITPEESNQGAVTQHEPKAHPAAEVPVGGEGRQSATTVEAPMTPDSRVSAAKGEGEGEVDDEAPVLATSPARSAEDHVEHAQGLCSLSTNIGLSSERSLTARAVDAVDSDQKNSAEATSVASRAGPAPAANGVHRRLTILAELPPAFYPSHKQDTYTPPAEDSEPVHTPSHRSQLSPGAAAFSVASDATAILPTSYEPEQDGHHQQRPPPGFAPPEFTPSFFPGHSHHPSLAPAEPMYSNGSFPNGSFSHDRPVNGKATGYAQSPSKSHFGEQRANSEQDEEHQTAQLQNGAVYQTEPMVESSFELAAYLSTQFGNPEFADFILQIRSPDSVLVSIPVHGIVVVRSPAMAEAIRRSMPTIHRTRDARRMLDVLISDSFVTRESLEEAVKVLYGAPLLSAQAFLYGIVPYVYESDQSSSSTDAPRRMRQLLAYIAAGRALRIPSMQVRGVELARSLLRWDTIDQVLYYALQTSSASRAGGDAADAEDPFGAALLSYALEFMAYTFPVDFTLYTTAPELQELPRLPVAIESRMPTHNPRLSKIRFGDAPLEDDSQPSHASRMLSSILLSLPLPLVDRVFNHRATANQIGWTGAAKIMREVIEERENRRRKAMIGQLKPTHDSAAPGNEYAEERVEQVESSPLHPSGYRLAMNGLAVEG
jgi:hypothetical protein